MHRHRAKLGKVLGFKLTPSAPKPQRTREEGTAQKDSWKHGDTQPHGQVTETTSPEEMKAHSHSLPGALTQGLSGSPRPTAIAVTAVTCPPPYCCLQFTISLHRLPHNCRPPPQAWPLPQPPPGNQACHPPLSPARPCSQDAFPPLHNLVLEELGYGSLEPQPCSGGEVRTFSSLLCWLPPPS